MQGDPQYTAWQKTRHAWSYFDAGGHSGAPTVTGNVSGSATGGVVRVLLRTGGGLCAVPPRTGSGRGTGDLAHLPTPRPTISWVAGARRAARRIAAAVSNCAPPFV